MAIANERVEIAVRFIEVMLREWGTQRAMEIDATVDHAFALADKVLAREVKR